MTYEKKRWFMITILGALLAGLFWAALGPPGTEVNISEILVSEVDVAHQAALWQRTWGRPPTAIELKKAVDGYVRNEILYREALARGMDREDPRVRMALIQKMQMLAAGRADVQQVTEEDLAAFFALREEQYKIPAQLSLVQVFFKDATNAQASAKDLLAKFQEQEPSAAVLREAGDTSMLETAHKNVTAQELVLRLLSSPLCSGNACFVWHPLYLTHKRS